MVGHSETPDGLDLAPRLVIVAERVDRCLQILLLLDDRFDLEPLAWALRDEIATAARRIEVLLELVHESRAIGSAVSSLASVVARDRSTALEMLEVTVGRSLGRLALALVDPTLDPATRHQQLAEHTAVGSRTLGEWLLDLVMDEEGYWRDPWLRACAMYALPGELPAPAAVTLVSPFLHDRDRRRSRDCALGHRQVGRTRSGPRSTPPAHSQCRPRWSRRSRSDRHDAR